jgi:hypothetical protein
MKSTAPDLLIRPGPPGSRHFDMLADLPKKRTTKSEGGADRKK